MDISFAAGLSDAERRQRVYGGELIVLPPTPSSLDMGRFARELIEQAFAPLHPRTAHGRLEVTEAVPILARLKPAIHSSS